MHGSISFFLLNGISLRADGGPTFIADMVALFFFFRESGSVLPRNPILYLWFFSEGGGGVRTPVPHYGFADGLST